MKKVKRFLALFLCIIGCFAFAACGGDDEDESSKSNAGSGQSSMPGDDAGTDIYD
ncbi:MAG: hypothetical protein IJF44_00355 [Clostridia bacterium]|nr:hypothetical protein [Clostridia bacterium]